MKKCLLTFVLCISVLSLNNIANAAAGDAVKERGYISLNASKSVEVDPNIARVSFAVENTAETVQKASTDNNEISNSIIKALKNITNTQSDVIKTNNFSVSPIYSTTKDGKRVIKNYMAVNSITVETKDINKVAGLIDAAIAGGANRTDGLYYSYENDKKLCSDIYPQLLKDLKNQASLIVQSVGSSLDGIKHINASCSSANSAISNGRFFAAKTMMAADGAAEEAMSTPIESGKVKINVYLNADFYVK